MSELPPPDAPAGDAEEMDAPDMLAGELALGLLEGNDRAAAIRRVLAEPGFAREVERWRTQLSQLFDLWPEMAPPELFDRIERSIDGPLYAEPVKQIVPGRPAPSRLWPGLAAFSSIAAAGLLLVLVTRPLPVPPTPVARATARPTIALGAPAPTLVASIDPEAKGVPVTAIYDAASGAIRLTEAALADGSRSAELWVIPADGTPHSLGLLRSRGTTALTLSAENRARIAAGATLAVSLEPIGGSPTGQPTGPVVAKGSILTV